jgi:hypothetical protein
MYNSLNALSRGVTVFVKDGSGSSTHSSNADQQKTTLVFFIGGVTYAEVSALRFLSQLEDGKSLTALLMYHLTVLRIALVQLRALLHIF